MQSIRAFPSLLIVFMGCLDCITTVIGILYFGAVECNPLLAGVISTNMLAFMLLKIVATLFVGLIFYQANVILMKTTDKTSKGFRQTRHLLKGASVGILMFFVIIVANNLIVLVRAI